MDHHCRYECWCYEAGWRGIQRSQDYSRTVEQTGRSRSGALGYYPRQRITDSAQRRGKLQRFFQVLVFKETQDLDIHIVLNPEIII